MVQQVAKRLVRHMNVKPTTNHNGERQLESCSGRAFSVGQGEDGCTTRTGIRRMIDVGGSADCNRGHWSDAHAEPDR